MKLLHFLWSGGIGGAERSVYQLARKQLEEDWEDVGVLFARAEGPYVELFHELGCSVVAFDASSGADLWLVPKVARRARAYDVHHFHSVEPLTFAASVGVGRRIRVYTERGGVHDLESVRKRARYAVARPLLRRFFHAYSGNTAHAARVAAERYGLPRGSVAVTYNGVDLELVSPRRTLSDVRRELGVDANTIVVGTSGHLKRWKRIDKLLEACAALEDVAYAVVVVGDGPDRPRLAEVAEGLGISDRVRFTGMKQDVADYLAVMDVFVLPSDALESFGNALVEAMGLGVASIAFADSPGICEHIEPGETGFIAASVPELTQILRRLALDPELRRKVGEQSARFVRAKYTPERMARAYRKLYEDAGARAALDSGPPLLMRRLVRASRRDADPPALG